MARHEAITKARWLKAQKCEIQFWRGQEALEQELQRVHGRYLPAIQRYAKDLPKDASILEIGCGPTCAAQLIEAGRKTYVDPLLDDFRRAYPGKLPKGEYLCRPAENINKQNASFDLILCLDALDRVMNPELVINEIERLLKTDGVFILGIVTSPAWLARVSYYLERFFPPLRDERTPYSYSYRGIEKTLGRHLDIIDVTETDKSFTPLHRKGWVFACGRKKNSRVAATRISVNRP